MPTVREIESALFALAPRELAMEGDNVGHLIGDPDAQVTGALVALDVTQEVLEEARREACQLIVTHHPVIWQAPRTLREDVPAQRLLRQLVGNDLCVISMHTNLDKAQGGVNDVLAETIGLLDVRPLAEDAQGFCRFGALPNPLPIADFARQVCAALGANGVRWSGDGVARRIAVGSGACGSCIPAVVEGGCDTFVTADLSYHQFLDAPAQGLSLIDAGHFPTEDPVCRRLVERLAAAFPGLRAIKSAVHREVIAYYSLPGETV